MHMTTAAGGSGGGGLTGQFGGPVAAVLTFFWLTFAFFGFVLALAGLSALQHYIYKDDNVNGATCAVPVVVPAPSRALLTRQLITSS